MELRYLITTRPAPEHGPHMTKTVQILQSRPGHWEVWTDVPVEIDVHIQDNPDGDD